MEIIKLQELQNDFNLSIEKSIGKKYDINIEINEILDYIKDIPNYSLSRKAVNVNHSNRVFKIKISDLLQKLFSEAFNSYMRIGNYELKRFHADTDEMYKIKESTVSQALEFSEYYKWLNSLLNTAAKAPTKNTLSHKQKLLALHYLGLNTAKYENTKIAKVLAEVLELSEDNTRIFLSYLSAGKNEVRTKTNLEKVNQLFEKQGISEISDVIKKDIEKL